MLRSILLNWFAAHYGEEIRSRIFETATEAVREAAAGAKEAQEESSSVDGDGGASPYEITPEFSRADVGFVFAMSQEYGCLLDLMKSVKVTKGNGLKYHEGALGRLRAVIVESGIGEEAARSATLALIQAFRPRRVISAGFAGGLVSSLQRNQIVVPRDIIQKSTGNKIDLWQKFLPSSGKSENPPENRSNSDDPLDLRFAVAPLLTSDEVVSDPAEKKKLGEEFDASLVDMETFAVAETCRSKDVPFLAVRVIFDPWDERLPSDLKNLTDSTQNGGAARILGAFLGTVSRRPSSLIDLYKLKENALVAADTLADALALLLRSNGTESP